MNEGGEGAEEAPDVQNNATGGSSEVLPLVQTPAAQQSIMSLSMEFIALVSTDAIEKQEPPRWGWGRGRGWGVSH